MSELDEPKTNVTVYGVVTQLSHVKNSRKNIKYFNAKLSDGRKTVRMVSFNAGLHSTMEKAKEAKETLMLVNCKVTAASGTSSSEDAVELVASGYTHVKQAPVKRQLELPGNVDELDPDNVGEIASLRNWDDVDVSRWTHLTVSIKVLDIESPTVIQPKDATKKLTKQECV